MTSILKVNQIQNTAGGVPTAADLGLNVTGSVLQVVTSSSQTNQSTSSASFVAITDLTASITPSSTSSKILVTVNMPIYTQSIAGEISVTVYRNGVDIGSSNGFGFFTCYAGSSDTLQSSSITHLDSPSSTSSVTYQVYMRKFQGGTTVQNNLRLSKQSITLMEIAG